MQFENINHELLVLDTQDLFIPAYMIGVQFVLCVAIGKLFMICQSYPHKVIDGWVNIGCGKILEAILYILCSMLDSSHFPTCHHSLKNEVS